MGGDMIVPATQDDTGAWVADIPAEVAEHVRGYSLLPDGTYRLTLDPDYIPPREAARREAEAELARRTAASIIDVEEPGPEDAAKLGPLFPDIQRGLEARAGALYYWPRTGTVYRCVQSRTVEPQHDPAEIPALWTSLVPPVGEEPYPRWVQPTGGHDAYAIDAMVVPPNAQDGGELTVFRSKITANTTEPGTDGTFHRWWEPVSRVT
jgi:hypothetical protein